MHPIYRFENLKTLSKPHQLRRSMNYSRDEFKSVKIPRQAQLELWPRLWPWVHFIHRFFEYLAKLPECFTFDISEILFLDGFIQLLNRFLTTDAKDIDIMSLIWSTEGFLPLLFRAWDLSLADLENGESTFATRCMLILPREVTPAQCEEVFDAAGGSLDHLADYLERHLRTTMRLSFPARSPTAESLLYQPMMIQTCTFVRDIDDSLRATQDTNRSPLIDTLATRGAVKHIAKAFCAMAETKDKEDLPDDLFLELLHFLGQALLMNPKHASGALHNLLTGIINCGYGDLTDALFGGLDWMLYTVLPSVMIDMRILQVLLEAVADAEVTQRASTEVFRRCRIFAAWSEFIDIVKEACQTLTLFRERERLQQVCDNVPCGRMGPKSRFRKCSGCSARVYCCEDCQRADWKRGGHRDACVTARDTRLAHRQVFSKRQLSFFRFLLTQHYSNPVSKSLRFCVHFRTAVAEYNDGPDSPQINIFQFLGGPPSLSKTIKMRPLAYMRSRIMQHDPTLDEWADRARRSNGRIAIHVLGMAVGQTERWVVLPLRMNMSFPSDAARRLVRVLPGAADLTDADVEKELGQTAKRMFEALRVPDKFRATY
ncbi:hypothetical protein C8F01DRAFT_1159800 [Mycena amicta]|nr:hypothetical protein C8F01DRAFT_1159800 [Mycena amicta]